MELNLSRKIAKRYGLGVLLIKKYFRSLPYYFYYNDLNYHTQTINLIELKFGKKINNAPILT